MHTYAVHREQPGNSLSHFCLRFLQNVQTRTVDLAEPFRFDCSMLIKFGGQPGCSKLRAQFIASHDGMERKVSQKRHDL